MNRKSIIKSIVIAGFAVLGTTAANAQAGANGLSDTSKVCAGQQVTLTAPAPVAPNVYTYVWADESNTPIPSATNMTYVVTPTATANTTGAPTFKIYKLTVTQTGGASCPSTVYTKVIITYPHLNTEVTSANNFYCLGNPVDIVLTANTTSAGTALATYQGYGILDYSWTPGTTPAAPAGTATGNVYTVAAANMPTTAATYTYNAAVKYADILVGTVAGLAACSVNDDGNVIIQAAPVVNSTTVTTSFQ